MKKAFIMSAIALVALTLAEPLSAAQRFQNFAEAQNTGKQAGYIVFMYPGDWDRYGEKLCRKLIADEVVRKAAGNSALLMAPVYQQRTEEAQARVKSVLGPLGMPGDMSDISYPAVVFYETDGRMYATLHGRELMSASPEGVARLIQKQLTARETQNKLLKQAHASKDAKEKNRLFLESSRVSGMGWPPGLRDVMKQVDPQDNHGYLAALNFGFGLKQGESIEDLCKRLDDVLDNPLLSTDQKQRACAVVIGHVRRSLGPLAGGHYITRYAKAMRKLDPDSTLGISAPVVMRDWVRVYRYGQGWSNEILPGNENPLRMKDVPITKPGTYKVNFKITDGRDPLIIKKVRLMDGSRCVAEEEAVRTVLWAAPVQTYTLNVKKPVKKAELEIIYGNAPDKRSTWGEITVSQ